MLDAGGRRHPIDSVRPMFNAREEDPVWIRAPFAGMTRPPSEPGEQDDGDLATQESDPEVARPPMYKVVLHNDDFTPMEFVVEVLQTFFHLDSETAVQIMLTVHSHGKATQPQKNKRPCRHAGQGTIERGYQDAAEGHGLL